MNEDVTIAELLMNEVPFVITYYKAKTSKYGYGKAYRLGKGIR